ANLFYTLKRADYRINLRRFQLMGVSKAQRIPAETAALSDSAPPLRGISTRCVAIVISLSDSPLDSFPIKSTAASSRGKSYTVFPFSEAASIGIFTLERNSGRSVL